MNLRSAYETHYHHNELGRGARSQMKTVIASWEKFTDNPDVDRITNATAAQFRENALAAGLAPYTVNRYWGSVRAILRRIGPVTDGNPWALELIDRVPAMRPVQVPYKRPRRLSQEELSLIYLACRHMKYPAKSQPNPGFWWQALIVLAYFTALRLKDLLKLRWEDIDTQERTVFVRTSKTGVEADLPLPDIALAHLSRLPREVNPIFGVYPRRFHKLQPILREQAGVEFTMHDIRKTAGSEADAVDRGMGKVLLLHAPNSVTERSYVNALPELRNVVDGMKVPIAFRHGPKMALRAVKQAKQEFLKAEDFAVPVHPPKEIFSFTTTGIALAGKFFAATPTQIALVRTLVEHDGIATQEQLWQATQRSEWPSVAEGRRQLWRDLSNVRKFLKRVLSLPKGFNPVCGTVVVGHGTRKATRYELFLPPMLVNR